MHFQWSHFSHPSHKTPSWFTFMALAQHPQGNLTGLGLLSTSPHTSSSHTTFQTGFPWVTRFAIQGESLRCLPHTSIRQLRSSNCILELKQPLDIAETLCFLFRFSKKQWSCRIATNTNTKHTFHEKLQYRHHESASYSFKGAPKVWCLIHARTNSNSKNGLK